jgi:hypothetical protein
MEWIKCSDRMPEILEECLVCSKDQSYALATYLKVGFIPFCGADFRVIKFKVTHWMPLPQPPKD